MLKDIRSLSYDELATEITELGFPKFRVNQIFSWIHEKCVSSFDEMTNISKALREKLKDNYEFTVECNVENIDEDDDTEEDDFFDEDNPPKTDKKTNGTQKK